MGTVAGQALADTLRLWCHQLRESVRKEATSFEERTILAAEAFRQSEGEPFRILRVARATSHIFANMPIRIREGEILVGWHPNTRQDERTKEALRNARDYLGKQNYWLSASEGHMAPDYPTILREGLDSIASRIADKESALDPGHPDTPSRKAFYRAAAVSIKAFQGLILRYSELARSLQEQAHDSEWRRQLSRTASICEWISSQPPRSFREAIQLVWFTFLAVAVEEGTAHGCFGPGHIDRHLAEFYRREEDKEEAAALLEQLFIKCNEFHGPGMSAVIVGIGGRNPDGTDATNELSYKILEVSDRARTYFPGVDILWHKDMDQEFVREAIKLLRNGMGQPSFFNTDLIIRGLGRYGVPLEHAVDHLPSTCTETSIQGRCNPWVAWPYVNIPMSLLYAMFGGRHPTSGSQDRPDTGVPQNYAELKEAFLKQLEFAAHQAILTGNRDQMLESWYRPFPLLSCFIQDGIERGRDISQGGALYNFLQPEAVGISNVVDGLAAVKVLEEDKRYTVEDFRKAIVADFQGWDELRLAIRNECPKHGNNIPWVNDLFSEVAGAWCTGIEGHRNYLGGPIFPGFLGWTIWIGFGHETPATPDGRKAGAPLANTVGACTGVQVRGAVSMLLSTLGLDQSRGLGGIVFNLRFGASMIRNESGVERLKSLIETAFDKGIYMVQINLASSEVLRDAQKNPESYSDLLVRIGGYLVPFTLLCRDAQEDVIARTETEI